MNSSLLYAKILTCVLQDAFDVGESTGIRIQGANIKNQDDCLAINSGTDIEFTGATCSGGHGISIGSVGGVSRAMVFP